MTTFYVATTGDNGDGGGVGDPWLTITYAIGQVSVNDEISVADGTYDEGAFGLQPPAVDFSAGPVRIFSATADPANVTIKGAAANNRMLSLYVTNATKGLTFEDITFTFAGTGATAGGTEYIIRFNDNAASDFIFQGCVITVPSIARTQYAVRIAGTQDSITFDDCTIAIPDVAGNFGIYAANNAAPTNITISDCTITAPNASSFPVWFVGDPSDTPTGITLSGTTITGGDEGAIFRDCQNVTITNNTISISGSFCIQYGVDTATPDVAAATGSITGNDLFNAAAADGHTLLLGRGTSAVSVSQNICYSSGASSFAIVNKGDNNIITNNFFYGEGRVSYMKGAVGTLFTGNVSVTTSGFAFATEGLAGGSPAHRDPNDTTLVNNLLVALNPDTGEVFGWVNHGVTFAITKNDLLGPIGSDLPASLPTILAYPNAQSLFYVGWPTLPAASTVVNGTKYGAGAVDFTGTNSPGPIMKAWK